MNKIIISIICLVSFLSLNADTVNVLNAPFIGYTKHYNTNETDDSNGTKKKNQYNIGLYSKFKNAEHTFDLLLNYENIKHYDDSSIKNLNLALLYYYPLSDGWTLKSSVNYLYSSKSDYDQIFSLLGGLEKSTDDFKYGGHVSYSKFNSASLAKSVNQLTPYFGFYFGDYNSFMGNFFAKVTYDFISLHSQDSSLKDDYSAHSLSLQHFKNRFETNIELWFGESVYALRNYGLTNHYLNDLYKDALIISTKYKISDFTSVQLSYLRRTYIPNNETESSTMKNYLVSAYFKF